ncbi:MAG: M15 family metallopeptidase [Acidimicrobiia bacterium]|nr:M15 family metallopeptidase [Acidimicrobiia bacterium]
MIRRHERGQVVPLLVVVIASSVGLVMVVGALGERATRHARTQTAADATALAAATGDAAGAADVAAANGAVIEVIEDRDGHVEVAVSIGDITRVAAAEAIRGDLAGLAPAMIAAIRTTEGVLERPIPISSGYRTTAEQQWLWDHRDENPLPVAPPGTSLHEQGLAIDVPANFAALLAVVGPNTGLCRPLPVRDPVHFELCRPKPSR